LAGLVAITNSCNDVEPYIALIIGFIAGILYYAIRFVIRKFQIDDPLDAFPIHAGCGMWGVIAGGLFNRTHGALYGGKSLGA
jgi:Amt family ammonium transporter